MASNGNKELGRILQKLEDISENIKDLKDDMKCVKEETITQKEKIRVIEIQVSSNCETISQIDKTVWGVKLQMTALAAAIGGAAGYLGSVIKTIL